jgi:ABC-type Na+ efflux pump permease subunit
VRERERGNIEQLIVTPIRPWELIIGKITPYILIALFDTLETLFIGSWWFGGGENPGKTWDRFGFPCFSGSDN